MSKTTTRYEPKCSMVSPSSRHDGYRIGPVKCGALATKFVGGKPYCTAHYLDACYVMAQQLASLSMPVGENREQMLAARNAKIKAIFQRLTGMTLAEYEMRKGVLRR